MNEWNYLIVIYLDLILRIKFQSESSCDDLLY